MSEDAKTPERTLSRRAVLAAGAAGLAGTGVALGVALSSGNEPETSTRMAAAFRPGPVPSEDPANSSWKAAEPIQVALSPQQLVPPFLHEASLDGLTVRALHNGSELAFLLEWRDSSRDDLDGIARFRDAVAVQLPAKASAAPPSITMGGPGTPVHILQWRATWQRDVDGASVTGLDELYPRAVRDLTPEELLGKQAAAPYYPGRAVGNPLSSSTRTSPVEEIVAEGFGSVTALEQQRARGKGVHEEESWRVAVGLPMKRGQAGDPIRPGTAWPVAFAVWLGSAGNRGARKHFANWVTVDVEST
jgi:hypothetical protein